jgi:hypothetical protein
MARRRTRARARPDRSRATGSGGGTRRRGADGIEGNVVPRVLMGAVDGVEVIGIGALQFARDVMQSAVSGAANIGAEALSAAMAGTRGVVSAASRMVGDIAGTAQGTLMATIDNARRPGAGAARMLSRRAGPLSQEADGRATSTASSVPASSRRRTRRLRAVRPSVAA